MAKAKTCVNGGLEREPDDESERQEDIVIGK
jgi:hypothetical protein